MSASSKTVAPLTPLHLPEGRIERVRNALVVPVQKGGRLPNGVFRANGTFCEHSRTLLSQSRFTNIPDRPDRKGLMRISGRHLYGGVMRDHFGHFLLESLGRLWAFDHIDDPVDGVLFSPRRSGERLARFNPRYEPLFDALAGEAAPLMFTEPVVVEELLLPSPGFGHQAWIVGTAQFRSAIHSRLTAAFPVKGVKDIYVSRSRLDGSEKAVDKEARIERLMVKSGYEIFHPQEHSIATQIAKYRAARRIVGPDGSAFHLAACVARPDAKITVIQRRRREKIVQSFIAQFKAFGVKDIRLLNPLVPNDHQSAGAVEGPAPINFRLLVKQLQENGCL
ncbi:glycosyltransferase family 61 protein [Roseovarius rhodophyticola]|uniref:Glycosyltransferase 61 family protein n=1 Tax=Roseovarius rhodophyticola TaxID=3080827 RepID=A0ABZ2TAF4_9RHOB|nr:glycosyltransferase 61 family protein [Roseovarius sp. W115]MDV2930353.1 glycosyltransferase 61 family protein [Roseovarius sp. W115]